MNLKDCALIRTVQLFESIGFMGWHARVLRELSQKPQSVKELSRKTGLFQYHVRGVVHDLLAFQLVDFTRAGISIRSDWAVLSQLVDICENHSGKSSSDWEAAFEVVTPQVLALKEKWDFND